MANSAVLLLGYHDDPDLNQRDPRTDIVVEARSILPVLWCSVFTVDDIRMYPVETTEGERAVCPMLITPSDKARLRSLERGARFADVFPATLQAIYQKWVDLLNGIEAPCLMLSNGGDMGNGRRSRAVRRVPLGVVARIRDGCRR